MAVAYFVLLGQAGSRVTFIFLFLRFLRNQTQLPMDGQYHVCLCTELLSFPILSLIGFHSCVPGDMLYF